MRITHFCRLKIDLQNLLTSLRSHGSNSAGTCLFFFWLNLYYMNDEHVLNGLVLEIAYKNMAASRNCNTFNQLFSFYFKIKILKINMFACSIKLE